MQLKQQKMDSNRKPVDYIERIRLLQIIIQYLVFVQVANTNTIRLNAGIWIYKNTKMAPEKG